MVEHIFARGEPPTSWIVRKEEGVTRFLLRLNCPQKLPTKLHLLNTPLSPSSTTVGSNPLPQRDTREEPNYSWKDEVVSGNATDKLSRLCLSQKTVHDPKETLRAQL